jgi:3-hydroxyacyl-CoA dehydrogenase / enoyl-CoA hydratase / 3-hydroxybutyryl-CoA epimerase
MTAVATRTSITFEPAGDDGIARIVIDRPDDAVNAVNVRFVEDLTEAVHAVRAAAPRGVILVSGKRDQWVAGADLKMLTEVARPSDLEAATRRFQGVVDELAWLPCTSVAALNGAALGGGLELALACDYRVAADVPSVSIGQPEVNLGLLPAGGGTQRLPRLIGLQRALDLILTGRRLSARRARRAGLVDEVVHPTVLERAARAWALKPKRSLSRPLVPDFSMASAIDLAEQTPVGRRLVYAQARKTVLERTGGHYPAPLKALEAVETGFERGMAAGLEAESHAFAELASSDTAKNLIWLFLTTQRARRAGSSPGGTAPGKGDLHLGVVGAGFMGAAIAEVGAVAGVPVRLRDLSPEAVARGLATVRKLVDEGVSRRRFDAREGSEITRRVSGSTDYAGFSRTDLVIEAVFEDLTVKRNVVRELEAVVPRDAVIASNTSAIPIHDVAAEAQNPERIVGMHFFSPAQRMPLLEVIRPAAAADWAVARAVATGTRMGKTPIVVGDSPGFYTSRVLGVMMNEAALLLDEGARMEDVDRAMTAFGFPVGPFVLYDEVGIDVAAHVGETVGRAFGERIPGTTIVADLVARGETGRKVGRGFYVWPKAARGPLARLRPQPRRAPNPFITARQPEHQADRPLDEREIQNRLVLLFVNEAVRCLDEGVLQSPTDGDVGAVLGLGFPPFLGGPFHYADSLRPHELADRLGRLEQQHGVRYKPAESIEQGRRFFEEQP